MEPYHRRGFSYPDHHRGMTEEITPARRPSAPRLADMDFARAMRCGLAGRLREKVRWW